ncbi:SprT-like domain-containing protein [Acinetobacter sp.]|uniref:SprT family zinc-dependent metalloprotease n=1 Tax=Acinetobacter sp. TaxID=472 RepID=UPI00388F0DBD
MSNLATLCHDENTNTWSAEYEGQTLVKSVGGESSKNYVISRIHEGKCAKALKLNVTGFVNAPMNFAPSPAYDPAKGFVERIKPNNLLTVAERYELLDECVDIIIRAMVEKKENGNRSLIITGTGSLGKTFHTKEKIREHGLLSTEEAQKIAYALTPEEQEVADMILRRMKECKKIAEQYYKENPVQKKGRAEAEDSDDEDDEGEELTLRIGEVDFTGLHTSMDIDNRTCGGKFFPGSNKYQFNIKLAMQNPDEYHDIVVPHEMAHHIQSVLYPKSLRVKEGHGKEWCKIMTVVFGIPADRYHSMDTTDVRNAPELEGDYHYVKGYSSAKGLFRTLFENRHKLIVFDDCDAAWKNEVSANLLKAALDSDEERWISWNVEGFDNSGLPKRFLFEGRVIFISNVASEEFPQPLISRSLRADIELTIEETFERMRQILPSEKFAPGTPMEVKQMAYDFLYEHREMAAEISSRSLLNVIQVANSGSKLWKRIALSNIA